jgi:hypothetical protein
MMSESEKHTVVAELLGEAIRWEADPHRFLWLKALGPHSALSIRVNPFFPDDGGAFVLMQESEALAEFDDFPAVWSRGPLVWPDSASR